MCAAPILGLGGHVKVQGQGTALAQGLGSAPGQGPGSALAQGLDSPSLTDKSSQQYYPLGTPSVMIRHINVSGSALESFSYSSFRINTTISLYGPHSPVTNTTIQYTFSTTSTCLITQRLTRRLTHFLTRPKLSLTLSYSQPTLPYPTLKLTPSPPLRSTNTTNTIVPSITHHPLFHLALVVALCLSNLLASYRRCTQ